MTALITGGDGGLGVRPPVDRRTFLIDVGHGAVGIAVVGILAGCAAPTSSGVSASPIASGMGATPLPAGAGSSSGASPSGEAAATEGPPGSPAPGVTWTRVNLGFVSAYILARAGEAAIVDTGVSGSAGDIEAALASVGLDWASVSHVIVTHLHGDHAGSSADVLERAADAVGYAGAADLPSIASPRPLTAVGDGDRVFDLAIIETPGHTAGHVVVLDEVAGVLVAGDALRTSDGAVTGPTAQFTDDMAMAATSIRKLAGFAFETLLVGHGEPITEGASDLVAALASR